MSSESPVRGNSVTTQVVNTAPLSSHVSPYRSPSVGGKYVGGEGVVMLTNKQQLAWDTLCNTILTEEAAEQITSIQGRHDLIVIFNAIAPIVQRVMLLSRRRISIADLRHLATLDGQQCSSVGDLHMKSVPPEEIMDRLLINYNDANGAKDNMVMVNIPPLPQRGPSSRRSTSPPAQQRPAHCTVAYQRAVAEYKALRRTKDIFRPVSVSHDTRESSFTPHSSSQFQSQPRTPRTGVRGPVPAVPATARSGSRGISAGYEVSPVRSPSATPLSVHKQTPSMTAVLPESNLPRHPEEEEMSLVLNRLHVRTRQGQAEEILQEVPAPLELSPRRVQRWQEEFNTQLNSSHITVEDFNALSEGKRQSHYVNWRFPMIKRIICDYTVKKILSEKSLRG